MTEENPLPQGVLYRPHVHRHTWTPSPKPMNKLQNYPVSFKERHSQQRSKPIHNRIKNSKTGAGESARWVGAPESPHPHERPDAAVHTCDLGAVGVEGGLSGTWMSAQLQVQ